MADHNLLALQLGIYSLAPQTLIKCTYLTPFATWYTSMSEAILTFLSTLQPLTQGPAFNRCYNFAKSSFSILWHFTSNLRLLSLPLLIWCVVSNWKYRLCSKIFSGDFMYIKDLGGGRGDKVLEIIKIIVHRCCPQGDPSLEEERRQVYEYL